MALKILHFQSLFWDTFPLYSLPRSSLSTSIIKQNTHHINYWDIHWSSVNKIILPKKYIIIILTNGLIASGIALYHHEFQLHRLLKSTVVRFSAVSWLVGIIFLYIHQITIYIYSWYFVTIKSNNFSQLLSCLMCYDVMKY